MIDVDSFTEYQELVRQVLGEQPKKLNVFLNLDDVKKAAKALLCVLYCRIWLIVSANCSAKMMTRQETVARRMVTSAVIL